MIQENRLLLWSINERLGGKKGLDFPEPGLDWMDDIINMADEEAKLIKQKGSQADMDIF